MAFSTNKEMIKAKKNVEAALKAHGVDVEKSAVKAQEGGAAWAMKRGSAAIMIALNPSSSGIVGRLRMISPIVRLSAETPQDIFRHLLEQNAAKLFGVSFGVAGNEVVIVAERGVRGLDRSEVDEMLATIGHYADEYDDALAQKFAGVRVCDL